MSRFLVFLLLLAGAAPAEAAGDRFSFVPAENGVFRLDNETGAVSLCFERGGALICMRSTADAMPAPDAGAEKDARVAALEARIAALEAERQADGVAGQASEHGDAIGRIKVLTERMMQRVAILIRGVKAEPAGQPPL